MFSPLPTMMPSTLDGAWFPAPQPTKNSDELGFLENQLRERLDMIAQHNSDRVPLGMTREEFEPAEDDDDDEEEESVSNDDEVVEEEEEDEEASDTLETGSERGDAGADLEAEESGDDVEMEDN